MDRVSVDDPELGENLARMRLEAEKSADGPFEPVIFLPGEHILYDTVRVAPDQRIEDVVWGSLARRPTHVGKMITWDGLRPDGTVRVAAVSNEILEEAEEFASEHGIDPFAIAAKPAPGAYDGHPVFSGGFPRTDSGADSSHAASGGAPKEPSAATESSRTNPAGAFNRVGRMAVGTALALVADVPARIRGVLGRAARPGPEAVHPASPDSASPRAAARRSNPAVSPSGGGALSSRDPMELFGIRRLHALARSWRIPLGAGYATAIALACGIAWGIVGLRDVGPRQFAPPEIGIGADPATDVRPPTRGIAGIPGEVPPSVKPRGNPNPPTRREADDRRAPTRPRVHPADRLAAPRVPFEENGRFAALEPPIRGEAIRPLGELSNPYGDVPLRLRDRPDGHPGIPPSDRFEEQRLASLPPPEEAVPGVAQPEEDPSPPVTSLPPKNRPPDLDAESPGSDGGPPSSAAPSQPSDAPSGQPESPGAAAVARYATVREALPLGEVSLIGVYGSTNNRRALVRLPSGGLRRVEVGDSVDGGEVSAIGGSDITYVKDGRPIRLSMPPFRG